MSEVIKGKSGFFSRLQKRSLSSYWINPQYQSRYIAWWGLSGLLLVILSASIFYVFIRENYLLLVDLGPMTAEAKAQMYHELNQVVFYLGLLSLLFLIVSTAVGIILSHRAAGALYHFKRVFESVKSGNLSARVRLREKDDFKDVAQIFNEMMDTIEKRG